LARAFAAAELGAGEPGAGAEEIEERHAGIHVPVPELEALAVDGKHHRLSRRCRGRRRGGRRSHRAKERRGACLNPIPIWDFHSHWLTRDRQGRGRRQIPKALTATGPTPHARVVSARGSPAQAATPRDLRSKRRGAGVAARWGRLVHGAELMGLFTRAGRLIFFGRARGRSVVRPRAAVPNLYNSPRYQKMFRMRSARPRFNSENVSHANRPPRFNSENVRHAIRKRSARQGHTHVYKVCVACLDPCIIHHKLTLDMSIFISQIFVC
jgi:hypothetical protein